MALTFAPNRFAPRINKRTGLIEWAIHQEGGSIFVIDGRLAGGLARQTSWTKRSTADAHPNVRALVDTLISQRRVLVRILLIPKPHTRKRATGNISVRINFFPHPFGSARGEGLNATFV